MLASSKVVTRKRRRGSSASSPVQRTLTLLDDSFARKEQKAYRMPPDDSGPDFVIERGDTLQTTCAFDKQTDRVIMSRPNGEQEICVMVVWAWPAGVLHNEFSLGWQFGLTEDTDCLRP